MGLETGEWCSSHGSWPGPTRHSGIAICVLKWFYMCSKMLLHYNTACIQVPDWISLCEVCVLI